MLHLRSCFSLSGTDMRTHCPGFPHFPVQTQLKHALLRELQIFFISQSKSISSAATLDCSETSTRVLTGKPTQVNLAVPNIIGCAQYHWLCPIIHPKLWLSLSYPGSHPIYQDSVVLYREPGMVKGTRCYRLSLHHKLKCYLKKKNMFGHQNRG